MKILIFGGNGFIGSYMARHLKKSHEVISSSLHHGLRIDITDADALTAAITHIKPDVIFHAAGIKDVKLCEKNKSFAKKVNYIGTRNIARASAGSFLVYLSTDYVFDGKTGHYSEKDEPNPWTYYGKSKLMGENAVIESCAHYAICRLSGVYGSSDDSLLGFVLSNLRSGKTCSYFTDVYNSPTYIGHLAKMLDKIMMLKKTGIYHTAGSERINRYDFARKTAKIFNYDDKLVLPLTLGPSARKKQLRPYDISLDIENTQKIVGFRFSGVDESIFAITKTRRSDRSVP